MGGKKDSSVPSNFPPFAGAEYQTPGLSSVPVPLRVQDFSGKMITAS